MPDIPEDFYDAARGGEFPADEFLNWLDEHGTEEQNEDFQEFMHSGLSMEWATIAMHQEFPDVNEWDHVSINRDESGEWSVSINGETVVFTDPEAAEDLIWADLYFHLVDLGIEFDKDIHSIGGD